MDIDIRALVDNLKYNPREPLLFNSGFFIWYFAFFIITYSLVSKNRNARVITIIIYSLYFFYKACGWYVGLVIFSAIADFILSNTIYKTKTGYKKKVLLVMSVILNLGCCFILSTPISLLQLSNDAFSTWLSIR